MNSINTGKQSTGSFSWYSGSKDTQIKSISVEKSGSDVAPIQVVSSIVSQSIAIAGSPKNSPLPRAPVESHSLLAHEVVENVSPVVDRIQARLSPMEPSRIKRTPILDRTNNKHQSAMPLVDELPLKRVRTDATSTNLDVALDLNNDFRDFNTVSGSDIVDFWFSHQTPSDIIALEEAERSDRMKSGSNAVLVGKFYEIQKEFMTKVNPIISIAPIQRSASSIIESLSEIKSAVIEKGIELIESAKKTLETESLSETLKEIVQESIYVPQVPLESESDWKQEEESIEFVWPRIRIEHKAAWAVAKSELAQSRVDPVLFGKWKQVNCEIKQLSSRKSLLESFDGSFVGKAAQAIDDAIHYTADWIQSLRLSTGAYNSDWARLQEEKERARRINSNFVDPVVDARKAHVEQELLSKVAPQY